MIDENAYGLLVSFFDLEGREYAQEPDAFAAEYRRFTEVLEEGLTELAGEGALTALDLGHAVYLELPDELACDPVDWLRQVRARLTGREIQCVAVLSFGGRWLADDRDPEPFREQLGSVTLLRASLPSEPLRRAIAAAVAAEQDPDSGAGWGPGLYLDGDALDALGKKLKNVPTPLVAGGATFYRIGR